jgi:hypothetical protein
MVYAEPREMREIDLQVLKEWIVRRPSPRSLTRSSIGHRPFRFRHWSRNICGRGYSGWTFCGMTSFTQRVINGSAAGFHWADALENTDGPVGRRKHDDSV